MPRRKKQNNAALKNSKGISSFEKCSIHVKYLFPLCSKLLTKP